MFLWENAENLKMLGFYHSFLIMKTWENAENLKMLGGLEFFLQFITKSDRGHYFILLCSSASAK